MVDIAFYNDQFLPVDEIKMSPLDLSIHRGYGIFDYFVAEDGVIIWFDDYMDRFYSSAEKAKLPVKYSREELKQIILELIKRNQRQKSGIKIVLTGGESPNGFTPTGESTLLIFSLKFPNYDPSIYVNGAHLVMDEYMRPNPGIKTINYFNSVLNHEKMIKYDAIDVLYYYNNIVYETSRSNVYIVKNGTVITKGEKVLGGITRKNALRVVKRHYTLELRPFTINELLDADEVFITSSTKGILPIVKVEDHIINNGKVGPICFHLVSKYQEEVWKEKLSQSVS